MTWLAIACLPGAPARATSPDPLAVVEAATARLLGSATPIGGRYVLTNRHVIDLAERRGAEVALSLGGRIMPATIAGVSGRLDIAVLVAAEPLGPTPAIAATLGAGAAVSARGPSGDRVHGSIVSRPWNEAWGPALFARLPVAFGFSGGPVTDASGALVGLVTAAVNPSASELLSLRAGATAAPPRETPVVLILPIGPVLAEAERLVGLLRQAR